MANFAAPSGFSALRNRTSETRAEDALKKAETELEESLQLVRQAMQEFSTKPVRV
jgi:hypothetical protein